MKWSLEKGSEKREHLQLPLCMIVGRCQLCHGVHLHTSSGQSACKCKQYLLFAEEVPC